MKQVTSVIDQQIEAYRKRDIDSFLSFYVPDVQICDIDGSVRMDGSRVMRERYGQLFENSPELAAEIANRITVCDVGTGSSCRDIETGLVESPRMRDSPLRRPGTCTRRRLRRRFGGERSALCGAFGALDNATCPSGNGRAVVIAVIDPTKLARRDPHGRAGRVARTNRIVYVDGLAQAGPP
jgi:hypothetical protein